MKCINASSNVNASQFRFTSKENTKGARNLMHMWWNELNNLYGMGIHYYVHGYSLSSHDSLYGEDPTAAFSGPTPMLVMGVMDSDSMVLSKFGIQTQSDFTAIIPRAEYAKAFGSKAEPKAGDLLRLVEWGCDQPGACGDPYAASGGYPIIMDEVCESVFSDTVTVQTTSLSNVVTPSGFNCYEPYCNQLNFGKIERCPYIYEVTERRHEMPTQGGYNTFMGHYVWIVHCKRFDYSYEAGIGPECGNQIVGDEKDTIGIQPSGDGQTPSPPKKYPDNVEDDSDSIWDYGRGPGNNTDPYGGY